ncbi:MAG TPA: response regulator [Stellaceae bacterium]|nr:response regulator [Stellaceae bacterium]
MTPDPSKVELQPRPVCVVDDDPWVLDSLTVLLQSVGFDVLTFGSGTAFLADERRRTVGCLLIDQHMPGMNGLDAIDELRREGVTTPAIVITGRLDANIAARAAELGIAEILEKPFSTKRVVELVRGSLDQAP